MTERVTLCEKPIALLHALGDIDRALCELDLEWLGYYLIRIVEEPGKKTEYRRADPSLVTFNRETGKYVVKENQ